MLTRITLLLSSTLSMITVFAQDGGNNTSFEYMLAKTDFKAQRVIPPAPEAAELGKYGNIPVSLFTGTPQINIPLYNLKGNSLALPISINYNSAGFKPQEIAGWTGLGWSLNAGGVITKSVCGNPDIASNYFNGINNYTLPPELFAYYDYIKEVQSGLKETQPDMYFFNFDGHCGKFFIGQDYTIVKKQRDNLKITSNNNNSFTIIDGQGVTYFFNDAETSSFYIDDDLKDPPAAQKYYSYPSSWYLTSITSADGQEVISFNYYFTQQHTLYNNFLANESKTYSWKSPASSVIIPASKTSTSFSPPVMVRRKYLQNIIFTRANKQIAKIDFVSAPDLRLDLKDADFPGERLLQSIQVFSTIEQDSHPQSLIKQYNFTYSYFGSGIYEYNKRLRLDNIQEVASDGSISLKPPYYFEYNSPSGSLPAQELASIDHWGFYNTAGSVSTLLPSNNYNAYYATNGQPLIIVSAANRVPDFNYCSYTVLNKITYPTGGYSKFDYELNQAIDYSSSPTILIPVGGVRIKKITDYSFANKKAIVKSYQYTLEDGSTSGIAAIPNYISSSTYHYYPGESSQNFTDNPFGFSTYNINPDEESVTSYFTVSASTINGLGSVQGSHIGYSRVIESQMDESVNISLGSTVYKYYLGSLDAHDENIANGDLLEKTVYDQKGKILSRESNMYNYPTQGSMTVLNAKTLSIQDNKKLLCKTTYDNGVSYTYEWRFPWLSYYNSPACAESRIYSVKYTTGGYTYSSTERQLIQQTNTLYDQTSDQYITTTKTFTYGNPMHIYPTLIEQTSSNSDKIFTSKKYVADYNLPTGVVLDDPAKGIKILQDKNLGGAEIENLQYRQNIDGTNKRYINGCFNIFSSLAPYLKSIYRIEASAPLINITPSFVKSNGIFTYDPKYKLSGSLSYNAYGNLTEQAKTMDVSKSYVWDYFLTLPSAEVTNADFNSIAYTSFETPGSQGYWLIPDYTPASGGITGSTSYLLSTGATISKSGLNPAKKFIVSYWSRSGPIAISSNIAISSYITGSSHRGWTYYEHSIPQNSTALNITAANANIDELRLFPSDAQMVTYTYNPQMGITSQCGVNNQVILYEYDALDRLLNIKDVDGNILKNTQYNYGLGAPVSGPPQTLFYSKKRSDNYTRNTGCPVNTYPQSSTYEVPYGKYVSAISQANANNKAINESNASGQANANALPCLFHNTEKRAFFFKNDCGDGTNGGMRFWYVVPAHTYTGLTQEEADAKAQNDIDANGQNYTNANSGCSCDVEGRKMVNGTCELGIRFNISTSQMNDGKWQCAYQYLFSDGNYTGPYYCIGTSPCPIQ